MHAPTQLHVNVTVSIFKTLIMFIVLAALCLDFRNVQELSIVFAVSGSCFSRISVNHGVASYILFP